MRPRAAEPNDWMTSDPPGVVLKRFGGGARARRLARDVSARLMIDSISALFRDAFDKGIRMGRWDSANAMAKFLGVERSWLGRLMRGDSNVDAMKMGDVYLCADKLGLPLRIDCPSPGSVEESVLMAIVSKMREQRRTRRPGQWPDTVEKAEAQAIRHQAQKVGYIDDPPAREPDQWQRWLRGQLVRGDPEGPGTEIRHSVLKAVGLGDWLLAQQYLPQFESRLYDKLRALEQAANRLGDQALNQAIRDFSGYLAEAQEMLQLFRSAPNRAVAEVAKQRNWRPGTVEARLRRLELAVGDYQGEDAVLGRLIVRSPVLRSRFDALLSHGEWGANQCDATQKGGKA